MSKCRFVEHNYVTPLTRWSLCTGHNVMWWVTVSVFHRYVGNEYANSRMLMSSVYTASSSCVHHQIIHCLKKSVNYFVEYLNMSFCSRRCVLLSFMYIVIIIIIVIFTVLWLLLLLSHVIESSLCFAALVPPMHATLFFWKTRFDLNGVAAAAALLLLLIICYDSCRWNQHATFVRVFASAAMSVLLRSLCWRTWQCILVYL